MYLCPIPTMYILSSGPIVVQASCPVAGLGADVCRQIMPLELVWLSSQQAPLQTAALGM